jgi:DNA invertase Pin-like site-specific DNA recombinase
LPICGPATCFLFNLFGSLAEYERALIKERVAAGWRRRAGAGARGRPPTIDPEKGSRSSRRWRAAHQGFRVSKRLRRLAQTYRTARNIISIGWREWALIGQT